MGVPATTFEGKKREHLWKNCNLQSYPICFFENDCYYFVLEKTCKEENVTRFIGAKIWIRKSS